MKKITEDKEKEYSVQIKEFMNSDAWKEYALPLIYQSVQKELPKPNVEGWEERYRYAHAISSAFSMVINSLGNLSNKKEFLDKVSKFVDENINHGQPIDEA